MDSVEYTSGDDLGLSVNRVDVIPLGRTERNNEPV